MIEEHNTPQGTFPLHSMDRMALEHTALSPQKFVRLFKQVTNEVLYPQPNRLLVSHLTREVRETYALRSREDYHTIYPYDSWKKFSRHGVIGTKYGNLFYCNVSATLGYGHIRSKGQHDATSWRSPGYSCQRSPELYAGPSPEYTVFYLVFELLRR